MEITRIIKETGAINPWTAQDFLLTGKAAHGMGAELFFDHLFIFGGVDGETLADGPDPANAAPKRIAFMEDAASDAEILDNLQSMSNANFITLRSYYGMVRLNGYIYALGGNDSNGPIASVERCLQ
jgi:hypothetical protein